MNQKTKKNLINVIIIILYLIITFFIMLHHEPWRDEAQAWLLAKNLSLNNILEISKYEGHPLLWHIILMPFAKLGFPYITLNIISWLFMVATAVLVVYKSPFSTFTKCSILLSSPFIYFYISISRVYSLIAFLIIFIATIYNKKEEHPCLYGLLLLLLANTHVTMLGMVGILILDFYVKNIILYLKNKTLKENKKILFGFLISCFGIILLLLQLYGCLQTNKEVNLTPKRSTISMCAKYISLFITSYIGNSNSTLIIALLGGIIYLLLFWEIITLKKHKNPLIIFYASIIFQVLIFVFIYQYLEQTVLLTYFIGLFFIWLAHSQEIDNKEKYFLNVIVIAISLITLLYSVSMIAFDFKNNYSASKEVAEFINNNLEKNAVIISSDDFSASSVAPYCNDYMFFSPQRKEFFTYVTWNEKRKTNVTEDELKEIIGHLQITNNVYILSSKVQLIEVIDGLEKKGEIEQIFCAENSFIGDEVYYLYRIKEF